jgi:predicted Kef-type K+ transport protein
VRKYLRLFRYSIWTSIAVAAGLSQIGERSFILVASIFLNVFIVRAVMKWADPKLPAERW